jgi:putative phosphoribosyl transferase
MLGKSTGNMGATFKDRADGGKKLAQELSHYGGRSDVVVLGLPRGGVPVAYEVAKELEAPLDVFIVRKLGVPGHEELAMGAIASGGVRVLNDEVVKGVNVSEDDVDRVATKEQQELERRESAYRGERPGIALEDKTVLLVDDGLATGASMRAAVKGLREHNPKKIVVAVPTAPPETCEAFSDLADETVCLETPTPFMGVGAWYEDFPQTKDEEVKDILEKASERLAQRE